jgi:hypothetical protein
MITLLSTDFSLRRFAVLSLALCFLEILIFGSLIGLIHLHVDYGVGIKFVAAATYLTCVPGSLILAVVGLIFDRRRTTALIACGVSLVCGFLCTLQVLV